MSLTYHCLFYYVLLYHFIFASTTIYNTIGFHYLGSTNYVANIKLAVKNGHHAQTLRDIYMSLKCKLEKANGKFAFFFQLKQA